MRRIFAIALFALLLGVGVVALIETDPGYVLVAYGNYTLESSLWVGLLLLFALILLVYLALRLVFRLVGGQRSLVSWLGTRKTHHAARLSTRGLINFLEGNWARSRRQVLKGATNNEAPLLNYLLAARASHHLGEPDKVSQYLGAAADAESAAVAAVELAEAEIKVHAGQYDQALAVLDNMGNASSYPRGLELRRAIYTGQGNWEGLARLLPELRKQKLLAADALRELESDTYRRLLLDAVKGEGEADTAELGAVWQKVPSDLKQDVDILCAYVELLLRGGDHAAAEKLLQRSLKQHWDARLVRLYGLVESANVPAQLTHAESWLAAHPDEPELLLCLGRLSARDKLWGKARDYFESSYRLQRSAEVCAELGRLLTGLGEPKVAAAYFREGLLLSESDLPTLPEPEKLLPLSQRLARS
ncbi:MAG: heme biosynthesis protein HemY [Haliea sp.]|jgi:HemY protein|nr:heme biosynthesis protein HemY [Haliea sp.]